VKDAGSDVRLRAVIEAQGDNRHDTPQRCLKTVDQLICRLISRGELARAVQEFVHPKFATSPQCASAGCRHDLHRHPGSATLYSANTASGLTASDDLANPF